VDACECSRLISELVESIYNHRATLRESHKPFVTHAIDPLFSLIREHSMAVDHTHADFE